MWLKCLPPSSPLRSSSYFYMCSSTKNFIQMYIQLSNKLTCGIGGLWSKGSFNFTTLLITFCHKYMYICVYRLIFIILLSSVFLTLYFVQGSCYLLHIIIVFFFSDVSCWCSPIVSSTQFNNKKKWARFFGRV